MPVLARSHFLTRMHPMMNVRRGSDQVCRLETIGQALGNAQRTAIHVLTSTPSQKAAQFF